MGEALRSGIASGRIIDLILLLVLLEFAALCVYRWMTRRGLSLLDTGATLAAGVCLLMTARCALLGMRWELAMWLSLALCAHIFDLARRYRAAGRTLAGATATPHAPK